MSADAPKIDPRSAAELVDQLVALLPGYTTHPDAAQHYPFQAWREYDPASGAPLGRSAALIGVFARFGEMLIERLNQVPQKNFLAFLDLLGASRQPPQPARVPLTFLLAAGSPVDALVPAGTQVAAPPGPGEKAPVIFETERPLVVTAARLGALLTVDPEQDSYGDWSDRAAAPAPFAVFRGERAFEHVLYLGDSQLLGYPQIKNLRVALTLGAALPGDAEPRAVQWERWDGAQWLRLEASGDAAVVNLAAPGAIDFGALAPFAETAVDSRPGRWLRCRLLTPVTRASAALGGMVRDSRLPKIDSIVLQAHLQRSGVERIAPDFGFSNAAPVDLTKEFFAFGEKPRPGDTLSLASTEAFSKNRTDNPSAASAQVELDVQLANSHLLGGSAGVRPSRDLKLAWECWNGAAWEKVGASSAPSWLSLLELDPPILQSDPAGTTTLALLQGTAQPSAQVKIRVASDARDTFLAVAADGRFADQRTVANGVNVFEFEASYQGQIRKAWITLVGGTPAAELRVFAPPSPVGSASVLLKIFTKGDVSTLRVTNGGGGAVVNQSPPAGEISVPLLEGRNDLLVEALTAADARVAAATLTVSRTAAAPAPGPDGFSDGSFAFTQSGVVSLRLPGATAKTALNGQESFWLRVRLASGDYGKEAGYVLKNPLKPEDGFTLVPATFRPPLIAAVRIGYDMTTQRAPQACLAFNQLGFEDCTTAAADDGATFAPFAATEASRPALHLGLSLPAGRASFPNTTISLYAGAAAPRYGERAEPLSPESSALAGAQGASVAHQFVVTNPSAQPADFDLALLGYGWPASSTESPLHVDAGATRSFEVRVDLPADGEPGDSDRGFVRLRTRGQDDRLYSAAFTSAVGVRPIPQAAAVTWQYWDGAQWAKLAVQDSSEGFTRPGLVDFLPPANFVRRRLFGREAYWVRAEWTKGDYAAPPQLSRLLLNTTLARQTTTFLNEVLGSSNGAAAQGFRATHAPVLAGQALEVREPELPASAEQARLLEEEGADAVRIVADAGGRRREIWVRWHEVDDFHGSGPRDRHYVIDHLTGEIRFGDGANGRVPPRGTGNLRLARYQTGGGRAGNRAAGAIAQLKTTVPYVEKASNPEPAAGGAEAETNAALVERMPRTLRHRGRAVTLEDYEDLARLASAEVARALCVPLRDLSADALGAIVQPGAVSVIVVPATSEVKPLPALELLARVQDFLEARAAATTMPAVVGPLYIRVDVSVEVALESPEGAGAVERAVRERLAAFLHPLSGGLDGTGWDFGRSPHRSDLFALIESVPGVDHVRYLQIAETEDQPGVRETGRFLVFSGEHRVALVFEET